MMKLTVDEALKEFNLTKETFTPEQYKQNKKVLLHKYHPDINKTAEAEEKTKRLLEARDVIDKYYGLGKFAKVGPSFTDEVEEARRRAAEEEARRREEEAKKREEVRRKREELNAKVMYVLGELEKYKTTKVSAIFITTNNIVTDALYNIRLSKNEQELEAKVRKFAAVLDKYYKKAANEYFENYKVDPEFRFVPDYNLLPENFVEKLAESYKKTIRKIQRKVKGDLLIATSSYTRNAYYEACSKKISELQEEIINKVAETPEAYNDKKYLETYKKAVEKILEERKIYEANSKLINEVKGDIRDSRVVSFVNKLNRLRESVIDPSFDSKYDELIEEFNQYRTGKYLKNIYDYLYTRFTLLTDKLSYAKDSKYIHEIEEIFHSAMLIIGSANDGQIGYESVNKLKGITFTDLAADRLIIDEILNRKTISGKVNPDAITVKFDLFSNGFGLREYGYIPADGTNDDEQLEYVDYTVKKNGKAVEDSSLFTGTISLNDFLTQGKVVGKLAGSLFIISKYKDRCIVVDENDNIFVIKESQIKEVLSKDTYVVDLEAIRNQIALQIEKSKAWKVKERTKKFA